MRMPLRQRRGFTATPMVVKGQANEMPPARMNPVAAALGPVSLIGGTAAIYSSLLQNPSSTLTPLSMAFMMLLALQYALQPRLSKKYIAPHANKQHVALVEEVTKTGMAAALLYATKSETARAALFSDWSLGSSLAVAGLPAALYALQGVWQYASHQHLDPVTFNGLSQTKTLSAALCCYIVLKTPQSPLQIVALVILMAAACIFQGQWKDMNTKTTTTTTRIATAKNNTTSGSSTTSKTTVVSSDWWLRGVVPCLGAAMLSGLAGALSQKGLQLTGTRGRDPFLYTMEISFYSALVLIGNMVLSSSRKGSVSVDDPTKGGTRPAAMNWKMALIPIVTKAAGGVVTALVHKYAGSVAKGFALLFGLVLSGGLQLILQQEDLKPHQVVGTLLIMLSTHLHFTHPPT